MRREQSRDNAGVEKAGKEVARLVLSSKAREHVPSSLAEGIARQELAKGFGEKEAVKRLKGRLHQLMLSFEPDAGRVFSLEERMRKNTDRDELKNLALEGLKLHSSTKERLCHMEEAYSFCFSNLRPSSVLDLACGMNPLALPWMGLPDDVIYTAADASGLCGRLVGAFFATWKANGSFTQTDLSADMPEGSYDVALLLKALPTLDRIQEGLGIRCLAAVRAPYVVVSFPTKSLGGCEVGMEGFYAGRFEKDAASAGWRLKKAVIGGELFYLVTKR